MRFLHTTFFKATAIVLIASTLLVGAMSFFAARGSQMLAIEQLGGQATGLTRVVAAQLVGAMRFGGGPQIENVIASVVDDPSNPSSGAVALDQFGNKIASHMVEGDEEQLIALGKSALETGADAKSDDGLEVAIVVFSPQTKAPLGVIVTGWSDAGARAIVAEHQRTGLLIAAGILAVVALVTSLIFRSMIAQPLRRVEETMEQVSGGAYGVEVPETRRRDEVGRIARSLEDFRKSLAASEETNKIALMRGAALSTSSTAMMLADNDHIITDVNEAMIKLMRRHAPSIRKRNPAFDPEKLIGTRADKILEGGRAAVADIDSGSNDKMQLEQELETGALVVEISPVLDDEGNRVGQVAEWRDVTAGRHNAAILNALDTTQLRAEFRPEGILSTANDRFCESLGAARTSIEGQGFQTKLCTRDPSSGSRDNRAFARINAGETIVGQFEIEGADGRKLILDGTFGAVRNRAGEVLSLLLMGSDVTASVTELAAAEATRQRDQAEQKHVVDSLRTALSELSEGDIQRQIPTPFPGDYESLRQDFNRAKSNLLAAMRTVLENASSIRAEATQITSAAQDMSHRTETQAATLEETAAALNELTASVKSAADGADRANQMVADAKSKAETSGNVVKEAVLAMGEIEESSTKISRITSVIDEIAFQTNLLALNAGVEAARAGEAGRGFAVVASEVRALAQRSSDAAREIAQLISSSSNQVKRGVELVGQAGEALNGIQVSVADIYGCVSDIAVSTREQSSGLSEINTAMHQLDQVTQQNAAMFEETSAASQSLLREANGLGEAMGQFRLGEIPKDSGSRHAAPRASTMSISSGSSDAGAQPAANSVSKAAPAPQRAEPAAAGFASRRGNTALAAKPVAEDDEWEEF